MSGMFGDPNVWLTCVRVMHGMLRRSFWYNTTRQQYTLRVGLPSVFELEDTQLSWIFVYLQVERRLVVMLFLAKGLSFHHSEPPERL